MLVWSQQYAHFIQMPLCAQFVSKTQAASNHQLRVEWVLGASSIASTNNNEKQSNFPPYLPHCFRIERDERKSDWAGMMCVVQLQKESRRSKKIGWTETRVLWTPTFPEQQSFSLAIIQGFMIWWRIFSSFSSSSDSGLRSIRKLAVCHNIICNVDTDYDFP